jgi:hypothetical protein
VKRLVVLILTLVAPALPAVGLWCVTEQSMTPEEVVEAGLASGEARYDLAMVVRVGNVERDGTTQTAQVEVFGIYGLGSAPDTAVVTFAGADVAGGTISRLVEGSSYFLPVIRIGPDGEPNYVTSCDPVTEVTQPEATALDLAVVADQNGMDYSLPFQTGDGGGSVTVVILVLMVLLLLWTLGRRRSWRDQFSGTDSDPRRPPSSRR